MDRRILPFALVALIVLSGCAWFVFARLATRDVAPPPLSPELADALERINDKLDRQAGRLDRLEAMQVRHEPDSPRDPERDAAATPRTDTTRLAAAGDDEARAAEHLRVMEERLVSDPLAPAWASSNERAIDKVLAADYLKRQHLPVPEASATRCQSHLCRISMTFPDHEQASRTQEMLLMAIAPSLPNAQTYVLPRPDGSIEMVIFAGDPVSVR